MNGTQYQEGQTASGPNGAKLVFRGGAWMPFSGQQAPAMAGGGASANPPGLGEVYREKIAPPLTDIAARGVADIGEKLQHPMQQIEGLANPAQYMQEATTSIPHHQLPPWAKEIAEYIVPQTATSAATTAASLMMPEVGLTEKLGTQALGPMERLLSSRLMRTVAGTGIGAAAGAVSGEGAQQGAIQGAETFAPAELAGAAIGRMGRSLGEEKLIRDTTTKFGKTISRLLPWAGKIEKGADFADAFMGGDRSKAILGTGEMLRGVKDWIAQSVKGHQFHLPTFDAQGIPTGKYMTFQEADTLMNELQKGYGFSLGGDPRQGDVARQARAMSFRIRDHLAHDLNQIKAGAGDAFLKARKQFDAAKTLTDMFDARGLFDARGMNQGKLIDRVQQHSEGLERSLGEGTTKSLLDVLKRGFLGEGKDISHVKGKAHVSWGLTGPHYRRVGGKPFQPIGEVPGYMRPQMKEIEAGISNALPQQQPPQSGLGTDALDKSRAEAVAPTPSASTRAMKVSKDLAKGKQPDVHRDLARGRLSEPEVEKLLQYANSSDPSSIVQGMPIEEVLNAAEVAGPDERKMLMPMIMQRLKAELPKMQNKTQQANLAQRFQRLQAMPAQAEA